MVAFQKLGIQKRSDNSLRSVRLEGRSTISRTRYVRYHMIKWLSPRVHTSDDRPTAVGHDIGDHDLARRRRGTGWRWQLRNIAWSVSGRDVGTYDRTGISSWPSCGTSRLSLCNNQKSKDTSKAVVLLGHVDLDSASFTRRIFSNRLFLKSSSPGNWTLKNDALFFFSVVFMMTIDLKLLICPVCSIQENFTIIRNSFDWNGSREIIWKTLRLGNSGFQLDT